MSSESQDKLASASATTAVLPEYADKLSDSKRKLDQAIARRNTAQSNVLVYSSASLLFSFCLLLFRDKQQRIVEQAQKELEKLKAKLQMEENLVEKLTAIRDALERGKLIHRFEGLGKGPKLGEHLMLMGAKEQKWNAQEGQRQAGVKARLEAEKATLAGMEQKSATPPPVYNALLPLGMPSSSAVPLLAQPFFKIATPSPSARTSSAQVSSTPQASTPDLEREELEKFAENNASILTTAPPAGTEGP